MADTEERIVFSKAYAQYNMKAGRTVMKVPIMGYKELDLYTFYKEVQSYGGYHKVISKVGTWSKIWKNLINYDPSITDASFRLKRNYERFLLDFEHFQHPTRRSEIFVKKIKTPNKTTGRTPKPKKSVTPAFRDLQRDIYGRPKMPLILGEVTIESLGTVIQHPNFVTDKHVWPVGFTSHRYFSSMINPNVRVKYTSEIRDSGNMQPQFRVTAEDDPEHPIISHSPSGCWRIILKRVLPKDDSRVNVSVSGRVRFGLAHPVTVRLLNEMAGKELNYSDASDGHSTPESPMSDPGVVSQNNNNNHSNLKRKRSEEEDSTTAMLPWILSSSHATQTPSTSSNQFSLPSFRELELQLCASSLLILETLPPLWKKIRFEDEEQAVHTLNEFRQSPLSC